MRKSGILLPVFSLPGAYGIGTFSQEARDFIDFLKEAGQSCWQILPVGPTGSGDSPYQTFSTFAGNPYFISLEDLIGQGLLTAEECGEIALEGQEGAGRVDYGLLYERRGILLRRAYGRSRHAETDDFRRFCSDNAYWLPDYCLFMAVKGAHAGEGLDEWEDPIRRHEPEAVLAWTEHLREEIEYQGWLQYEFFRQWKALRAYAAERGISIIGDVPIYVSRDSADFWTHPDLFQLDGTGRLSAVAGCPPDGFSADGQVWGNPLYDWKRHEETGFDWWIRRIGQCRRLYDVIRLDHFRGFDQYFSIPAGDRTAAGGHWEQGPGMKLFEALRAACPDLTCIAEDLGYVTDSVRRLVQDSGFPGTRVLEFAFDSRDSSNRFSYMPYNCPPGSVMYTGTHDNETLAGWLSSILPEEKEEVMAFFAAGEGEEEVLVDRMVRTALASPSDLCVIPLQDYLGLGNEARINRPSTESGNWQWRLEKGLLTEALRDRIRSYTSLYGRLPAGE